VSAPAEGEEWGVPWNAKREERRVTPREERERERKDKGSGKEVTVEEKAFEISSTVSEVNPKDPFVIHLVEVLRLHI
jgi:hypothetical protein